MLGKLGLVVRPPYTCCYRSTVLTCDQAIPSGSVANSRGVLDAIRPYPRSVGSIFYCCCPTVEPPVPFTCTHDRVTDWHDSRITGIPPTSKKLNILFTSIVNVRGDRLCHEHLPWDHAVPGRKPEKGKQFEYRVPRCGRGNSEEAG
ncbi:hypothetical protein N657DRAFT_108041 [Parathielavia appendiculata]|uniref:Uncharacterized protein n=1 Tax=Parathielavia appendiculata TaxID=2587402 RepID=A0AAN6TX57_9PEZI|nr:hypothetical protein N657DRAFT_108041 [Parathielavia appendiculata]